MTVVKKMRERSLSTIIPSLDIIEINDTLKNHMQRFFLKMKSIVYFDRIITRC